MFTAERLGMMGVRHPIKRQTWGGLLTRTNEVKTEGLNVDVLKSVPLRLCRGAAPLMHKQEKASPRKPCQMCYK